MHTTTSARTKGAKKYFLPGETQLPLPRNVPALRSHETQGQTTASQGSTTLLLLPQPAQFFRLSINSDLQERYETPHSTASQQQLQLKHLDSTPGPYNYAIRHNDAMI